MKHAWMHVALLAPIAAEAAPRSGRYGGAALVLWLIVLVAVLLSDRRR